ncbi:Threonine--tRNA ligase mitochondrial [Spathaspora sp. JA1]|nr:Threonine--tRNA ligase mitochondrial [Spathaspora sp. JA1]
MYITRNIAKELRIPRVIPRFYSNKPKEAISSTQSNYALSNQQLLYTTDPTSPGSIFFLPHGTRIFNKLIQFMKNQQTKYGFQEVVTPLIYKTKLWKQSGHWDNYQQDMFKVIGNDQTRDDELAVEPCGSHHVHEEEFHEYGLKPMNCPGHCMIFSKFERSYNELPIRYSDFSSLHRNEASGALTGLTRVRRFHQDDGHIFCELGQIDQEIKNTINLIKDTYGIFGIKVQDIKFYLSTRPEDKFIGDVETYTIAEEKLKSVLNSIDGINWELRPGDGAFYGPKIDVLLTDAFNKQHQVGTIQLDFNLPSRFELKYIGQDGTRNNRPILVHRAVFGSLERFFAILLDHYQGNWPFWINPRQAVIIPVSQAHHEYANNLQSKLSGDILNSEEEIAPITGYHFYVDVDSRDATVGLRIKEAIQKGYSYIIMVGDKDIANGTFAIRTRNERNITNMTGEEIYDMFIRLEKTYK